MLYRGKGGHLVPADDDAREYVRHMKTGEHVLCSMHFPRNPKFHRKFFAMLKFAFDHWTPPRMFGGQVVVRDFDSFRKQLIIAAGYHRTIWMIDGERVQLEARSIAWAKMDEQEFERLYEAVVRVLSEGYLPGVTVDVMQSWADQYANAA